MIKLIGDLHGDFYRLQKLLQQEEMTKTDHLLVAGDFGFIFSGNKLEREILGELDAMGVTICFIDGNHENFSLLADYPTEEWMGGTVHRIGKNILHLMRGQVFTIEEKKIFTMGGAASKDRFHRLQGKDWWPEELPASPEYREAKKNLLRHHNRVDYILTHQAPKRVMKKAGHLCDPAEEELLSFLDDLCSIISYKAWFFGHWHLDAAVKDSFYAVYRQAVTL